MNLIKKFKFYMGDRHFFMPVSLIFSGLNGVLALVPYIFIWLIIKILLGGNIINQANTIYTYAWWAFGISILSILVYYAALVFSHFVAFRIENNLRKVAMAKIMKMPMGFFDKNTTGYMRKIIDENAAHTHTFIAHILPDLAGSILAPICILVLIFYFDWHLAIACLLPIFFAFGVMFMCMMPNFNKFRDLYYDANNRMNNEAVEYVRGIPVVKVFQQSVYSFKKFYSSIENYREIVIKYTKVWRIPMSLYTAIINGFSFFLIPMAIFLIGRNGDYVTVIADMFLYILITPIFALNIMKIMYVSETMNEANMALSGIENLIKNYAPEKGTIKELPNFNIIFDNVSFKYPGSSNYAIRNISFTLSQGLNYALVGGSGGGKTTIARLIPHFWDVTEGKITIGGVDVRDIDKEVLMDKISFVFQNAKLFKKTILENIIYGNENATTEEINKAIELSQSREIIERLPNGLNTKIGAEGTYLSGGEQQRIILARAFLKNAPIIVLDEATAFADPENEYIIQSALKNLIKNKTVLMIAHRLTTVQNVDKIMVIEKGSICEAGTHSELLEKSGMYKSMWDEYNKSVSWTI